MTARRKDDFENWSVRGFPVCRSRFGVRRHGRAYSSELDYYLPVNHARRIPATCRVDITRAGLGDYICPPPGIATLYNALHCPKSICWM